MDVSPAIMNQSPLLLLAPELILTISDELNLSSAKQLRLTSKALAQTLGSKVLQKLTIEISRKTIEKGISRLEGLSNARHAASYETRELHIGSLSPTYDPAYRQPIWRHEGGQWVSVSPSEDPLEVGLAEEKMARHLHDAIASLKGVQSVEWTPYPDDSELTHRTVMDALKTLPSLCRFRVRLPNLRVPMGLDSLTGLQEIATDESSVKCQEDVYECLATAVARNPGLTSICISDNWSYNRPIPKSRNLHQLFKRYPSSSQPLRLRHLGLSMCLVRLDNDIMPHLKNLTSLRLTSIEDPYVHSQVSSGDPEEDLAVMQDRMRYGSSLDDIWHALRVADVRLETIAVNAVPSSLLQYLQSYSGLRTLHLTPDGFDETTMSDIMAGQFFNGSLDSHVQTLEDLQTTAMHEGLWCFGAHNVKVVSRFTKLRSLRMSIISSQLVNGMQAQNPLPTEEDVLKLLFDTVALCMPHIENVQVDGAYPEGSQDVRCGNPLRAHRNRVTRKMAKSISEYTPPPSCRRLPTATLSFEKNATTFYVAERSLVGIGSAGEDGSRQEPGPLRYVEATRI